MRILRDTQFIDPANRGAVAAIGNFDGVHLGHQAVIAQTAEIAAAVGAPLGIVTFEPHPREVFQPAAPPFRLMNAEAKAHRLEKLGVARLYELSFTYTLAGLAAAEFARDILLGSLGLAHVVVGADFCFGRGRKGTATDLERFGREMGFGVTIAAMVENELGEVSSTSIRDALSEGRPRDAAVMLGHWHRIEGVVMRGHQRGRELGFPTANLELGRLHPPRFGVYAVTVDVLTGRHRGRYGGAASIGTRPMFDGDVPNCETFLFDFAGDLYGAELSVGLVEFLRPEQMFDGLAPFIAQMDEDCRQAREILADV